MFSPRLAGGGVEIGSDVRLLRASLEGYRSAGRGTAAFQLDRLGAKNILIGPNNVGKSTLFRFWQTTATLMGEKNALVHQITAEQFDDSWWRNRQTSQPITATLEVEGLPAMAVPPAAPGTFVQDGVSRVQVVLRSRPKRTAEIIVSPEVYVADRWMPIIGYAHDSPSITHLNKQGQYISSPGTDAAPYKEPGLALVASLLGALRFLDPVRAIDREAGHRRMVDGSGLLKQIASLQRDSRRASVFTNFRDRLIGAVNSVVFEPAGLSRVRNLDMKGSGDGDLDLHIETDGVDANSVSIFHMGTGIAEIIVIFAMFLLDEDAPGNPVYFIEEPELHLHPGLLRRVMAALPSITTGQILVSTHSNVLLDSVGPNDVVYRLKGARGQPCIVERMSSLVGIHGILDSLGVAGSHLLQVNAVLWVEGPSDRIYIRRWLSQHAERVASRPLVEGSDYAFAFYGGKILSHHSLDDASDAEDLIQILRICRFAAVVMDRDLAAGQEEVRPAKRRVIDEATKDPDHRLAVLTERREIENDLDQRTLEWSVAQMLAVPSVPKLTMTGAERYPQEMASQITIPGQTPKQIAEKLSDKVKLARTVSTAPALDPIEVIPPYVAQLFDLIVKARL